MKRRSQAKCMKNWDNFSNSDRLGSVFAPLCAPGAGLSTGSRLGSLKSKSSSSNLQKTCFFSDFADFQRFSLIFIGFRAHFDDDDLIFKLSNRDPLESPAPCAYSGAKIKPNGSELKKLCGHESRQNANSPKWRSASFRWLKIAGNGHAKKNCMIHVLENA